MQQTSVSKGHPIFAAVYDRFGGHLESGPIGRARRRLLAGARGVVVDIGSGTGANIGHLAELGLVVTRIHAVEPDPHMARRLAGRLPPHGQLHAAAAEGLPFEDASVDTVVTTLVLCSVDEPDRAISEVRRVLRPGGQVLVLEHVAAANPLVSLGQRALRVPWRWAGAGCTLDRDTEASFTRAGFDVTTLRRFVVHGAVPVTDWVTGVLDRTPPPAQAAASAMPTDRG